MWKEVTGQLFSEPGSWGAASVLKAASAQLPSLGPLLDVCMQSDCVIITLNKARPSWPS